ncbi:capsule polysaccharide biosynthesis protein [Stipitochalara longipes BDJ]|nr:capsule polysaccharide biosynthesis protein [Stipitochalara longipes BDJ]
MSSTNQLFPLPNGCHVIPTHLLDLRSDSDIDKKNIWFSWSTGYANMQNCTKRTVRLWYRRFSKQDWTIRVVDCAPGSPSNDENFLDTKDSTIFAQVFIDGTIGGEFGPQYTSDFVRFPLLNKYGGFYADIGMMQIGDLDRLWNETIGKSESRFEIVLYNRGGINGRSLTNYFMGSGGKNPFFERCHKLFLAIWNENGGRTSTQGMHTSPLLKGIPLMKHNSEISLSQQTELTDYHTQEQVITAVTGLVDEETEWDGPKYVAERVYGIEDVEYSDLINEMTSWDGRKAFKLMSLRLPEGGDVEREDQRLGREIVEACLQKSFSFKLAHGMIVKIAGETLGTLWRANDGSNDMPRSYSHWLRYGMTYWNQNQLPPALDFRATAPTKAGPLLSED